jgi:thioredoxin 1
MLTNLQEYLPLIENETNEQQQERFTTWLESCETPILLDFYANWCSPCLKMMPMLEKVAQDFADKLQFIKVDVDVYMAVARQNNLMGVPTFMLFKNGKMLWQQPGGISEKRLHEVLNTHLKIEKIS